VIIQSGYGALAYSSIATSTMQRQDVKTASATIAAPAIIADQVSLSTAGKALAASERTVAQTKTPAQEHLLRAASSDRESAEKIAYDMTVAPSQIFYSSIYDMGADGKLNKLASSGRIIDADFRDSFNREASLVDAQRRAIYESEKAKGTDPVQIISKMIDHINSQSSDYLEATGWGWSDGVRMVG
jgi:hypothetical protein